MSDDVEYRDPLEPPPRRRDTKIDEAKAVLLERFFPDGGTRVYYGRQLEIFLERDFFHWITKKALHELVQDGAIKFEEKRLAYHVAHFYWPRRHRYPRRQINERTMTPPCNGSKRGIKVLFDGTGSCWLPCELGSAIHMGI